MTELHVPDSSTWVLATDGFRVKQQSPDMQSEDDCSSLLLGPTLERRYDADASNLILAGGYIQSGIA